MARDPVADRFQKKQQNRKLTDLANKKRGKEEVQAEKELLDKTEKTPPIKKGQAPVGRNDPCPCGSGKKFKKCCGAE